MTGIDTLSRHVMAFGSPAGAHFGHMVLRPGGEVVGYANPNEARWRPTPEGDLCFLDRDERPTAQLRHRGGDIWMGTAKGNRYPLHLLPALSIEQPLTHPPGEVSVIINTIPKAGTYLVEAAFQEMGFLPSRLHLVGSHDVDDYRGISESEMHRNPARYRVSLPVELVAAITQGYATPAHIEHTEIVDRMERLGARMLHVKRDLREVVVSLYRFKMARVDPVNFIDASWREHREPERLIGFMYYYADKDLKHIGEMARLISQRPALRFEDVISGKLDRDAVELLEAISPRLSSAFPPALIKARDSGTSTLSSAPTRWRDYWSPSAEAAFRAFGLASLNEALGYSP